MTLASALLLAYLAITATTTALPSSRLLRPRQGGIPPSTSPTSPLIAPLLADTCTDIFGTSGVNAFTRNLFVAGDGWLQGFVSPITGSLCSLSFAVKALQLNPSNATVAVYAADVTKDQIVAGGIKPVTTALASSTNERLTFTFCGNASMFLTEDLTYNFAITFAAASFPNVPLTLAFQNAVNSTGSFFGPSFTPIFTVVNEGIVFNLTTSAVPVSCGGASVSSSSSSLSVVETSTVAIETSTVNVATTTTAVVVPETTTATAVPVETTTTTAAVESTIPIIEQTTTAETTAAVETSTTAIITVESSTNEPVTTTSIAVTSTTGETTTTAVPTLATSTAEFTIVSTISLLTSTATAEPTTIGASTSTVGPATLPTIPTTTTTTTATATATAVPTTTCTAPLCDSCRATAWSSCSAAKAYTTCIDSPTLKLCYRLACAPHQEERDAYLKQCEQLEIWARYTHDDEIPEKW
ncbi:hypothetical protein BDZ88DRAFT_508445 [Geranomyces variabilis]|nr:hypothetical protein BDZ88DRAFT_508445 [Geranomyces variabilis]KAJ3137074.1 hypothetical protein HDU90_002245 [Geranomyces variabilis]